MSKQEFWTHWILGGLAAAIWFYGDKLGVPKDAQVLAASLVPGLSMHALGVSRGLSFRPPPDGPEVHNLTNQPGN